MVDVMKGDKAPVVKGGGGLMTPVANPLFGGDVKSLVTTQDVHMAQLIHEIDTELGDPEKYQVVLGLEKHREPVSETNPLTVHVHPATVDMKRVQKVLDAHVPNPDHGKTDEHKELDALRARLAEGDLALPDLNKILRSMLGS